MAGQGSNATPRATILDVAAAAGVSPSTVSNALNDRAGVEPRDRRAGSSGSPMSSDIAPTRRRAVCERPHRRVGLVLPTIAEPGYAAGIYYYSRFTGAAAQAAFARGYALTLVPRSTPRRRPGGFRWTA